MAHLRTLALVAVAAAVVPTTAFAYDRQTHEGITDAIVRSYEQLRGDAFGGAEASAIVRGGSAEDDDARFLNHFYDPVNYRGLTVLGAALGQPSESWAFDTRGQASWKCLPYMPCGHDIGYEDKLFSSPTDYSWNRAIFEYVYGDKERGLQALGHILHLIEDAAVPAHVRNDQHGHIGAFGDPDPYETYTAQFGVGSVPVPADLSRIPSYSNLSRYIDHVAMFTNAHFVSKDTLFKDYQLPSLDDTTISAHYIVDPSNNVKLAWLKGNIDPYGKVARADIFIDDINNSVAAENWRVLSNTAVLNGVGVIDLFFRSVEEEKRTQAIKRMNVSAAEKRAKELAIKGFPIVKGLYGSSLSRSDVADLLDEGGAGQAGAAALAAAPARASEPSTPAPQKSEQSATPKIAKAQEQKPPPMPETPPKQEPAPPAQAPSAPQPVSISPGFGGGGAPPPSESTAAAEQAVRFTIDSPSDGATFATTSVTFTGTGPEGGSIEASYGSTTASSTIDASGNWTLAMTLSEGTAEISLAASKSDGSAASSTTRTLYVDLTPSDAPVVSIPACDESLSVSFCLVPASSIDAFWNDAAGAASYSVVVNGSAGAASAATSSRVSVPYGASTTISVVARDSAGNAATSTQRIVYAIERPLVINEVGFGGVGDYMSQIDNSVQWFELKNRTSYDIDLSKIAVSRSAGIDIPLSGTLPGGTDPYLVITNTHNASFGTLELVVAFDALSAAGEQLQLVWSDGSASTTIDATPVVAACAGWCAGSASAAVATDYSGAPSYAALSMERIDDGQSGTDAANWRSADTYGNAMWGSPGAANTAGLPRAGVYCGTMADLLIADASFNPGSYCNIISRFITWRPNMSGANRRVGLYRGEVGSSTSLTGTGQPLYRVNATFSVGEYFNGAAAGERYFFAIWENPLGPAFEGFSYLYNDYFTASSTATALSAPNITFNYATIPFTYQP